MFDFFNNPQNVTPASRPVLTELIRFVKYNLDNGQWQQYQALPAKDKQEYINKLLADKKVLAAAKEDYYTVAAEVKALQKQGIQPSVSQHYAAVLQYFDERAKNYCAMTYDLQECWERILSHLAKVKDGEYLFSMAWTDWYINNGLLKNYHKKHD